MALEQEIALYKEKLPELLIHENEYVVIHQDKVLGFFPDWETALTFGYREAMLTPFLVKKIEKVETIHRLYESVRVSNK